MPSRIYYTYYYKCIKIYKENLFENWKCNILKEIPNNVMATNFPYFSENMNFTIISNRIPLIQLVIRPQQHQRSARHYNRNSQNQVVSSQRFIPRRALMYVPGSDERKLNKIPQIKADCICLDCEDGVAFNAKELARKNIRKLLTFKTQEFFGSSEASVRVNSVQSNLCSLDLDSILSEPPTDYLLPSSIHLPKARCSKII